MKIRKNRRFFVPWKKIFSWSNSQNKSKLQNFNLFEDLNFLNRRSHLLFLLWKMHLKLVLFLLSKMWKQPLIGFVQNGYSETYCKTHIKTIEIKPFFSKVTGSRFAEDSVVPWFLMYFRILVINFVCKFKDLCVWPWISSANWPLDDPLHG